ncbi:TRAP transporter small permease [Aliiroseovarius subalbicans]|uniref:TRAP transporter small permease n=1 Tax=Aliiroseovarius subalbicans TaxID=2925840 RepID=UPI001F59E5C1|nr:TRAP transporter small permease [uncultured Aliiroseovarius sp.]MCI2398318.1 TRAP transporter small permease [Aliiroseovarius subalbicans]
MAKIAPHAEARVGRILEKVSKVLAYFGGTILAAVAGVTVASIIGRFFLFAGLGPIKGDFEMVEMGCAIAVFSFLPYTQFKRGHVTVDLFVDRLPDRAKAVLGLIGDVMLTLAAYIILWRLWLGFGEKFPFGSDGFRSALGMGYKPFFAETTYELELPVWIPYGLSLIGAFFFFVVGVFTIWRSLNWVLKGREEHV